MVWSDYWKECQEILDHEDFYINLDDEDKERIKAKFKKKWKKGITVEDAVYDLVGFI